jgi:hypothetical protein
MLAPPHRIPPLRRRTHGLLVTAYIFTLFSAIAPCAAQSPPQEAANAPPVLLPWLSLAADRPLAFSFEHDVGYDPSLRKLDIRRSRWRLDRCRLGLFAGEIALVARGDIGGGNPSDVATTLTLRGIDVQQALRFLALPRANEIEGRLDGTIVARIAAGNWADLRLRLQTAPGSVRLSRALIREILGASLDPERIAQTVDPTLNFHFGAAKMIPIESMTIEGELGSSQMRMKIPINNAALSIDFEPRIDRAWLWDAWNYLKNAGLRDVRNVDWGIE